MRNTSRNSVFQRKGLLLSIVVLFLFIVTRQVRVTQLNIEDAFFLTKNSLKELKDQYLPRLSSSVSFREIVDSTDYGFNNDYPFNNIVNSFFPVDATISYDTNGLREPRNTTVNAITARYAAFSPIIKTQLKSKLKFSKVDACKPINGQSEEFKDRTIVVLRGGCSFVDKVINIMESGLNPSSVIIGNNVPKQSLITMYSSSFNDDRLLRVPILFITNEDYLLLSDIECLEPNMIITTAKLGSWFNIVLSIVLSPPLLIFGLYSFIKFLQMWRRKQNNLVNKNLVNKLNVYIYNRTHLIDVKFFDHYLKVTGQNVPLLTAASSSDSLLNSTNYPTSSGESSNDLTINGINVKGSANTFHALIASKNFFPSFKCSICLEKFVPLESRVFVLHCKHIYHEECLSKWLISFRRSCPLCNNTLDKSKISYSESLETPGYGSTDNNLDVHSTSDNDVFRNISRISSYRSHEELQSEANPVKSHGLSTPLGTTNVGTLDESFDRFESSTLEFPIRHCSSAYSEEKPSPRASNKLSQTGTSKNSMVDTLQSQESFYSTASNRDIVGESMIHHPTSVLRPVSYSPAGMSTPLEFCRILSQNSDYDDFTTAKSFVSSSGNFGYPRVPLHLIEYVDATDGTHDDDDNNDYDNDYDYEYEYDENTIV